MVFIKLMYNHCFGGQGGSAERRGAEGQTGKNPCATLDAWEALSLMRRNLAPALLSQILAQSAPKFLGLFVLKKHRISSTQSRLAQLAVRAHPASFAQTAGKPSKY